MFYATERPTSGRLLLWRPGLAAEDSPFTDEEQQTIRRFSKRGTVAVLTAAHETLGLPYHGISTHVEPGHNLEAPLFDRARELNVEIAGVNYREMLPTVVTQLRAGIRAGMLALRAGICREFDLTEPQPGFPGEERDRLVGVHLDELYIPAGPGIVGTEAAATALFGSVERLRAAQPSPTVQPGA